MLKTFPIDFIRQAFEQKLLQEHIKNPHLYGGRNQVAITSFYEQLKSQDQVDRFVETYRDLTEQQNRTCLLLNGVLISPENPTITNLYSSTIIPMTWTCSLRCRLEDRDNGIVTINNLIKELKGRKVDIAQLNCVDDFGNKYTEPFMVGTIGQGDGEPTLKDGNFIGSLSYQSQIIDILHDLNDKGIAINYENVDYLYCENENIIKVCYRNEYDIDNIEYDNIVLSQSNKVITANGLYYGKLYDGDIKQITAHLTIYGDDRIEFDINGAASDFEYNEQNNKTTFKASFRLVREIDDYVENYDGFGLSNFASVGYNYIFVENDGSYADVIFPPEHTSFEKYKLSFSFDAIRCDEPRNLNEKEYCQLSFSGSSTLVNSSVRLGNDLLKTSLIKYKIKAQSDITFPTATPTFLEPLEMPSGNNANTQLKQLVSNNFLTNTQTDAINITLQYAFIMDESIPLLKQLFNYGRYGTRGITINDISPNMIFALNEYWCSWGDFDKKECYVKLVENVDIENTESDTLTLSVSFQIQGEND